MMFLILLMKRLSLKMKILDNSLYFKEGSIEIERYGLSFLSRISRQLKDNILQVFQDRLHEVNALSIANLWLFRLAERSVT